ncbi:uncharacterized protein [Spinacia oleracea]|uniref:Uncharacterized protein isoform X2 n=1 Tax=Spinacia oleracea TaxID=3562 RepID=A0A9R0IZ81_SPIOL|nr:uncharacterized protein LOC110796869 isoform X2 [Spinacia oleracea]
MAKNDSDNKFKSARRKPLRDVSNGGVKSLKSSKKKTRLKMSEELSHPQIQQTNNADPLDRLLLVHSDISSLLRQIDELVFQAVKVDTTDKERITEIKSFTAVLSEIHSSLKPWVPRLQKAIDGSRCDSEIQFSDTCVGDPVVPAQRDIHTIDTPEASKYESLVSPSPLVSWRAAGCVEERGKQLFYLTPLPRHKTTTSKAHASTKLTVCEEEVPSSRNELSYRRIGKSHKWTPYPTGNTNLCDSADSESSSGDVEEKLNLKFSELIGIKPSCMSNYVSRAVEASPAWKTSPPKCCTLLEPLDEKHPKDYASSLDQKLFLAPKGSRTDNYNLDEENKIFCMQGNEKNMFVKVESTPLWKGGSASTIHRGKRPGENTLKRELWTKFEAASINECHRNFPVSNDISNKRFLERLEEASCDESNEDAELLIH